MQRRPVLALGLLLCLSTHQVGGQTTAERPNRGRQDFTKAEAHKEQFTGALAEFLEAGEGRFGDEGPRLARAIRSMRAALTRWDDALRSSKAMVLSDPDDAEARFWLGRAYLDRGRIQDALHEFEAAHGATRVRVDAYLFEGLAYRGVGRLQEALAAFRRATSLDADNPTASYAIVQILSKTGPDDQRREAIERFQQSQQRKQDTLARQATPERVAIRFRTTEEPTQLLQRTTLQEPIFGPAIYQPGLDLLTQGRYEDGLAAIEEASARDPLIAGAAEGTDQHTRVQRGSVALREGKLATAIRHLRAAVREWPKDARAHRLLGVAYQADGRHDDAIEQFKAAVQARPDDERCRLLLAGALIATRQFGEAEGVLRELIRVSSGSAGRAHYILGRLHEAAGRPRAAVEELEQAAALRPIVGLEPLYRAIASIHAAQMSTDEAIDTYRRALEENPNNPESHRNLSVLYFTQNRDEEALVEVLALLAIDPRSGEGYTGLSQLYFRQGRYADAVRASRAALSTNAHLPTAQYTLASALIRLGETEEGEAELEKFRQLQAKSLANQHRQREVLALWQEAAARLEQEDYNAAIVLLREAIEHEPQAGLYLALGSALLEARRYELAVTSFQQALRLNADSPDVRRDLAAAYEALGRSEESAREREIARRMSEELLHRLGGSR